MLKVSFDIDSYKTRFLGGARQYLFFALLDIPTNAGGLDNTALGNIMSSFGYGSARDFVPYLVRSTTLPDSSFEEVQIPYPGHTFKMAGNRAYGDWNVSFNIDEKGRLLEIFNGWHDLIYEPVEQRYSSPNTYMRDQQLFLIDGTGQAVKEYKLFNAWPKSISATSLDYSSVDIATVDINFSYQYYTQKSVDTATGTTGLVRSLLNKLTGSAISIPRI